MYAWHEINVFSVYHGVEVGGGGWSATSFEFTLVAGEVAIITDVEFVCSSLEPNSGLVDPLPCLLF